MLSFLFKTGDFPVFFANIMFGALMSIILFLWKEVIIVRKREYKCILLLNLTIILILLLFIIVEIKKWYS